MIADQKVHLSSNLRYFIHFVLWLLVIHLQFNLLGLLESFFVFFIDGEKFVDEAFIIIPSLLALFYWNSHFLIPRYLNRKSWWWYLLWLSISFIIVLFIGINIDEALKIWGYRPLFEDSYFFDLSLVLHLIVVGISSSLGISKLAIKNATQKEEAEEKQKEAELKYLTNQFNPHFLFNTLNGIYSLSTEEGATKTTEAILKLSEIMRYPVKNALHQKIDLKAEVNFIESYIELQRLRLGDDYPIYFLKEGGLESEKITPLLFIPIVENAFKYGVSQKDKTPILLKLSIKDKELFFFAENSFNTKSNTVSHQTGIQNLQNRLNIIYGQNYSLTSKSDGDKYTVNLRVSL